MIVIGENPSYKFSDMSKGQDIGLIRDKNSQ
jgi:hypothetical protein